MFFIKELKIIHRNFWKFFYGNYFLSSVAVTTWRDTGHPKMQQPVSEEGAVYEPPSVRSYDDLFPALPEFTPSGVNTNSAMGLWNNNTMRVGSSTVTQVFRLDP